MILGNLQVGLVGRNWELTLWVEDIFDEDEPVAAVFIPDQGRRFDFLRGATGLAPLTGLTGFNALAEARPPPLWGIIGRWQF